MAKEPEKPIALTPAERKAEQRKREKKKGFTDVTVKIYKTRIKELRAFADTLQGPKKRTKHAKDP